MIKTYSFDLLLTGIDEENISIHKHNIPEKWAKVKDNIIIIRTIHKKKQNQKDAYTIVLHA